jgi:outer membrane protein TolC
LRLADIAVRSHPALQSVRLEADAAHALGYHHRAWDPPEVAAEFYNAPVSSFPNPLKRQEEIDYSVSQKIPFPGKLRKMSEPEHLRAAAVEARGAAAALDLRRKVVSAWADVYAAEWSLRLARETRSDVDALIRSARSDYAGGMGRASRSLRAEREGLRLDAEILRMEALRRESLAMLNSLLGGDTAVSGVALDNLAPSSLAASFPEVRADAGVRRSDRPDLEAMRRERAMAEAEVSASRAERLPDFMVRGMYKDMRGTDSHGGAAGDAWAVMVGMEVPFIPFGPWSAGVRQSERRARTLRDKAGRDVAAMELMVSADVETARAGLESALGRATLAREKVVPLTEKILASARAEYAGGQGGFEDVVMALREARMAREEWRRAEAECGRAWADWDYATGGNL